MTPSRCHPPARRRPAPPRIDADPESDAAPPSPHRSRSTSTRGASEPSHSDHAKAAAIWISSRGPRSRARQTQTHLIRSRQLSPINPQPAEMILPETGANPGVTDRRAAPGIASSPPLIVEKRREDVADGHALTARRARRLESGPRARLSLAFRTTRRATCTSPERLTEKRSFDQCRRVETGSSTSNEHGCLIMCAPNDEREIRRCRSPFDRRCRRPFRAGLPS